jgi:glycosyltransferase involved in cell wall biosynthesis
MSIGIPVVVANRGALPEVAGDAGLLFDPSDAAALAERLREVSGNPLLRDRLRESGWRQADRFRWTESAEHVRAAWAQAVEFRRRRAHRR